MNRLKKKFNSYLIGGVIMWWFMLHLGIHATVTGVLLALHSIPEWNRKSAAVLERFYINLLVFYTASLC
jgi:NhaA family Na+:H+ antiporter